MTEQHFPSASILGYPRIGVHRELKRVLEDFWSGKTGGNCQSAAMFAH